MDYQWGLEQRLNIHYEMSLNSVIKRMKMLKGKDKVALCDEWYEVLVNDWEEEDKDYLSYWNDWRMFQ